jgi:CRP-like cAMP-binding protein
MEANLYLPGDYLVQKEDFGHEMHFIESGIMNCYSMNERQIILRIRGGDFMGEKALINLTKRIYPIAAETFCQVLSLSKRSFDTILAKFPQIESLVIEKCKCIHTSHNF